MKMDKSVKFEIVWKGGNLVSSQWMGFICEAEGLSCYY